MTQARLRRMLADTKMYYAEGPTDGAFFFFYAMPGYCGRIVIEAFLTSNGSLVVSGVVGAIGPSPAEKSHVRSLIAELNARYCGVKFFELRERVEVGIDLIPTVASGLTSDQVASVVASVAHAWHATASVLKERIDEAKRLDHLGSAIATQSVAALEDDDDDDLAF